MACAHSNLISLFLLQYIICTILVIALLATYFCTYSSMKEQLLRQFDERIRRLFDEKSMHNDTMHPIHNLFRCCGLQGPQDYQSKEQSALPASCCYAADCSDASNINEEGCATKGPRLLKLQAEINYYMCIAIFVLQVRSKAMQGEEETIFILLIHFSFWDYSQHSLWARPVS